VDFCAAANERKRKREREVEEELRTICKLPDEIKI
jgi:hypothetical protein